MSRIAAIAIAVALLVAPSLPLAQAGAAQAAPAPASAVPAPVRQAFPDADRFDTSDVLLTDEMAKRLDDLARARIAERMVTFYVAKKGAEVQGYAVLQSHVVRTKRETLLLAFEPDGRIRKIQVVSFLEPAEYKPSERWLAQFAGKGANDRLWVGDDLAPISGSTLSARGVSEQARWLLQALRQAREGGKVR